MSERVTFRAVGILDGINIISVEDEGIDDTADSGQINSSMNWGEGVICTVMLVEEERGSVKDNLPFRDIISSESRISLMICVNFAVRY